MTRELWSREKQVEVTMSKLRWGKWDWRSVRRFEDSEAEWSYAKQGELKKDRFDV